MPLVDMSLDRLKEYQGLNPRPGDFDAYWDRALAEMRAVKPKVELKPAEFQTSFAECFEMWFTGVRGARIHARYLRPRHRRGRCPAVLQFHGYSGNCGHWTDKLGYAAAGFCVAALDCRGQAAFPRTPAACAETPCADTSSEALTMRPTTSSSGTSFSTPRNWRGS